MAIASQANKVVEVVVPGTPVLEARALQKHFMLGRAIGPGSRRVVQAVNGVSFVLYQQSTLSIVGESGCGKTTMAKMLLNLEPPTDGSVLFRGTPLGELKKRSEYSVYRLGVQAVFQDSSSALNPRRRVHQIVGEPLVVAGTSSSKDVQAQVRSLLEKVGLDERVAGSFPHELSGGMRQRVAIAQALATNPSVIILDEPVSALDVSIRAQILNLLKDVQDRYGVSYILIAHDLATVRYLSHNVAAMYLGSVVEHAPAEPFFTAALHPYTLALLSAAIPSTSGAPRERIVLRGDLPSPASPPLGCRFHTRCWLRNSLDNPSICATQQPTLQSAAGEHRVACHFVAASAESTARRNILGQIARSGPGATLTASRPSGT